MKASSTRTRLLFTLAFQLSGSDSQQVMLHKLDLRSTGVYRCEVSAEGPSFSSVQGGGRMTVVRKFVMKFPTHKLSI